MKTKPNFQKIRHWLHIAIYILVLLLFANYESQRKQHPERNKLFPDFVIAYPKILRQRV